jgi:hypothetical protein
MERIPKNVNLEVKGSLYLQNVVSTVHTSGLQAGICEDILEGTRNKTQEPLEPWTGSDPLTHEDPSPNWGAGLPETGSIISLTG